MDDDFSTQVRDQARRKLNAERQGGAHVWFGLGMFGLIGWSIAIPTLLGALLGIWLDGRYPSTHSWTLAALVAGLCIGCWNAARWVIKEGKEMQEDEGHDE
jgi:ATP synthase protein I